MCAKAKVIRYKSAGRHGVVDSAFNGVHVVGSSPISVIVIWNFSNSVLADSYQDPSVNAGTMQHTEHRFPAPSPPDSARIWLYMYATVSPRFCPPTLSAPSERSGYPSHSEHRFPAPSSFKEGCRKALLGVWVLIRLWNQHSVEART